MNKQSIVISLGGSIIIPEEIDLYFLKKFRKLILSVLYKFDKIIIVTGGGKICRKYQKAALGITSIGRADLDWIGIACTKVNGELVRSLFSKQAYREIIDNPREKIKTAKKIIIGTGSVPGSSSDLDAILLAENFGAKKVINLSNISHVYTKDPKKFKNAEKLEKTTWKEFKKIIGGKFKPGMNAPFDPVAARHAEQRGIEVAVMKGTDLKNFENYLQGRKFKGTVID